MPTPFWKAKPVPQPSENGYPPDISPEAAHAAYEGEVELLHASIKIGTITQVVIAIAAVVGLIYLLKVVLLTTLCSMLLAFALDPMVSALARVRLPRVAGSLIAMVLVLLVGLGLSYFFYNRAVEFTDQFPKYSNTIRDAIGKLHARTEKIEQSTRNMISSPAKQRATPVEVIEAPALTRVISAGGRFWDITLALSFVPFLSYFMLTWKTQIHSHTLHLFPKEHRLGAYRTIGRISEMIRSFIVGNLLVGLLNSVATTAIFWAIGLPYFYFLGTISAFVGLIPYLGIFLALLAPLAVGLGTINRTGAIVLVIAVTLLHVLTMNVLYPKIIGRRLRLNPLAVALSLLFWAWIWGAVGLLLAVPLVGATKIICDYVDSFRAFGAWLGD